ncbi:MAG: hypothetical protein AAB929_00655, partial [Patescibacteria group bacterium]
MTRILTKPPMDKFQAAIFAETQLIQTELKNSLGDRVDQNALADTIGFFTNLAPIRRTTFKNQAEALGVAKGVYECQTQGEVLGIQGVLADSTARAELPHFVKVFKLAKQAHIQPDLHIFYLDWDYYPSLRRGEQVSNYPALKDQWKELGFPPENLHDLSEDTQERKEFYEMFNGQAAALDDARFPEHPLYRRLKKWIRHYKRQRTPYYTKLADKDRATGLTSEFNNQIVLDAANKRAICILAAEQRRKMMGKHAWGYSLFVTAERSPIEVAQYNTAISFLKSPGAKKDKVRLP